MYTIFFNTFIYNKSSIPLLLIYLVISYFFYLEEASFWAISVKIEPIVLTTYPNCPHESKVINIIQILSFADYGVISPNPTVLIFITVKYRALIYLSCQGESYNFYACIHVFSVTLLAVISFQAIKWNTHELKCAFIKIITNIFINT